MLKTGPDVAGLSRAEARDARIQFWRKTFDASDRSGQTHSDFCHDQGLSTAAYHWWKRVLREIDTGAKARVRASRARAKKKSTFLPLTVREPVRETEAPFVLEIAMGSEPILRVREGCDPALLERVIRILGAPPC
jgi:hypothetical protein